MLKFIPRAKLSYEFSPNIKPVETASIGELVVYETIDALGGQVRSEQDTLSDIDWSRVNGVRGPLYVKNAEKVTP